MELGATVGSPWKDALNHEAEIDFARIPHVCCERAFEVLALKCIIGYLTCKSAIEPTLSECLQHEELATFGQLNNCFQITTMTNHPQLFRIQRSLGIGFPSRAFGESKTSSLPRFSVGLKHFDIFRHISTQNAAILGESRESCRSQISSARWIQYRVLFQGNLSEWTQLYYTTPGKRLEAV